MTARRFEFTHDGHRFIVDESTSDTGPARTEAQVAWQVSMDGDTVLEFAGHFPFRDDDLRKRVEAWYEIQRPATPPL